MKKYVLIFLLFTLFTATTSNATEDRKETTCIIIHHSAGINGNVEAFRQMHKKRGWEDVGYHFVITNGKGGPNGKIQVGRPIEKVGSHAKGRNHNSVGICLVGTDKFTEKQVESLIQLLAELCAKYNLNPRKAIQSHHEKCPGPGLILN